MRPAIISVMSINAIRADLVYTIFFKDAFRGVTTRWDASKRLALVACPKHPAIRYSVILDSTKNAEEQKRRVSEVVLLHCSKHPAQIVVDDAKSVVPPL